MRVKRAAINELIRQVREGKPARALTIETDAGVIPALPQGRLEAVYWHPAFYGFGVRLLYTGRATWIVQHKTHGRTHKLKIGDARVLDEEAAKKAAKNILAQIELDRLDPQAAKKRAMETAKVIFEDIAEEYLAAGKRRTGKKKRANTTRSYRRYLLTGYYLQPFRRSPLDEITHQQIKLQMDRITRQSGTDTAWSCYVALNAMLRWAIEKGYHPGPSPMLRVDRPQKSDARDRVLTDDEIRTIWAACEAWEADAIAHPIGSHSTRPDLPRAVRLLFLTGCRAQEIGDLEWNEIDPKSDELMIPGNRTKNEETLYQPLVRTALDILNGINRRPGGEQHLFGIVPGKGLDVSRANRIIDERISSAGGAVPQPKWRLHDIRRTMRTALAKLGVSREIGERLLNHKIMKESEGVYDRYQYRIEKRKALERWEAELLSIVYGTEKKIVAPRFGKIAEDK